MDKPADIKAFVDALNRCEGKNKYIAWPGYPTDVNIYLRDKTLYGTDSTIGYITFPSKLHIKVAMRDDGRKRKKFKYEDFVFPEDMSEAIDKWTEYKPRKTKPRKSKSFHTQYQGSFKSLIVNPNFYGRITLV